MSALAVTDPPEDVLRAMFSRARRGRDKAAEAVVAHALRAQTEHRSVPEVAEACAACRRRRPDL